MATPKTKFLGCRVVTWLHGLANQAAAADGISQAELVRRLVIDDLRRRGMVPADRPPTQERQTEQC